MGLTESERRGLSHSSVWLFLLTVLSVSASAAVAPKDKEVEVPGKNWHIIPSAELAETYSDNINLAPSGREDWDLVTEVTPGLAITGESARLKADAVYRIQHLLYVHEPSRSTVNHHFDGTATAELVQEHLFFDTDAVVTQVAIDPSRDAGPDSINSVPRSDIYSLRMGPRYRQNLGGYASLSAGYKYGIVRVSGSGASDSDISRADVNLASGRRFSRLGWNLSYYDEQVDRSSQSTVGDAKHRVAVAEAQYALTRHFSILGRVGDEQHEFDTRQEGFENGTYAAGGFEWRPNRHTRLDALYGDRYQSASIDWNPSRRTSFHVGWRDTEVGANVGQSWDADISWKTRRTRWALTYSEQPDSFQQVVQGRLFFDTNTGLLVTTPGPGRVLIPGSDAFGITDELFIRKRAQLTAGFVTGRTDAALIIYDEERDYTSSSLTENAKGLISSVKWRFAPRTSWLGEFDWSRRNLRTSPAEFDLWRIETGLEEQIGPNSYGQLTVSHQERTSAEGVRGYDENRIEARVYLQF